LIEDEEPETSSGVVFVEADGKGCDVDVEAAVTRHEVLEPVLTKNAAEVWMKDWLSIPAYSRYHPCGTLTEGHVKFIKVGSSAEASLTVTVARVCKPGDTVLVDASDRLLGPDCGTLRLVTVKLMGDSGPM
jgi:hypothetical protein